MARLRARPLGLCYDRLMRTMAWTLAAIIVVLSLGPVWLRPETGLPRWAEHAAIFAALGAAFAISYRNRLEHFPVKLVHIGRFGNSLRIRWV